MNTIIKHRLRNAKRRIERRLAGDRQDQGRPMFGAAGIRMELSDKVRAISTGGLGLVHQLARETGLVDAIDRHLQLLKIHHPYHESDHVLNLAYHALCDGVRLEDIELRRNDEEGVTFYFGFKALANLEEIAENLPKAAWRDVLREPRYEVQTESRRRPHNVKRQIVRQRGFESLRSPTTFHRTKLPTRSAMNHATTGTRPAPPAAPPGHPPPRPMPRIASQTNNRDRLFKD